MMRPIRILTIGHSYLIGLNRAVMARVSRHPDVELTIAAPNYFHGDLRPLWLDRDVPDNGQYELVGLPAYLTRYIHVFTYGGLRSLIRDGRFDLVHAWEEPYVLACYQIARASQRAGSRFMFRTAQSLPKRYPPPFSHFERYCVEKASGWIAGGSLVHQALIQRGYPGTFSEVITLGVDEDHFRPDPQVGREVRRSLGFEGPVIGFLGRLSAVKGLDTLLDALEALKGPWNFLALGSGPFEARIQEWARQRGWEDRVRVLLAKHDEVPRYLQAIDIVALPSRTTKAWKEQFGRVIVEAFACGIPVVGSDSGEIPILLEGCGRVFPEGNAGALSGTLQELLGDPDLRRQLGEAGRQRCLDNYSSSRVAERYVEYYKRLVEESPPLKPSDSKLLTC